MALCNCIRAEIFIQLQNSIRYFGHPVFRYNNKKGIQKETAKFSKNRLFPFTGWSVKIDTVNFYCMHYIFQTSNFSFSYNVLNFSFSITFILSSASTFNLDQSKILSSGNGLMHLHDAIY